MKLHSRLLSYIRFLVGGSVKSSAFSSFKLTCLKSAVNFIISHEYGATHFDGESLFMPVNDVSSARTLIEGWMKHRKVFQSETLPAPEPFYFQFVGKEENGLPFTVLQPKEWDTSILMLAEITIGDSHFKSLESMRPKDRERFLDDLQRSITFGPATFAFDPTFQITGIPKGIQFSKEMCYDGLTEDRLSSSMRDVIKGVLFVTWRVRKEFGMST